MYSPNHSTGRAAPVNFKQLERSSMQLPAQSYKITPTSSMLPHGYVFYDMQHFADSPEKRRLMKGSVAPPESLERVEEVRKKQSKDYKAFVSQDEVKLFEELFSLFDEENSGLINKNDVIAVLQQMPMENRNEAQYLIKELESMESKVVFQDFINTCALRSARYNTIENTFSTFNLFDSDKTGAISFQKLSHVNEELGGVYSDKRLKEMISVADLDGDSFVSMDDFYRVVRQKN